MRHRGDLERRSEEEEKGPASLELHLADGIAGALTQAR